MQHKESVIFGCLLCIFTFVARPMSLVKKMASAINDTQKNGDGKKPKTERQQIKIKIKNHQDKEGIEIEIGIEDTIKKLAANYGKAQGLSDAVIEKLRFQCWKRVIGVRGQGIGIQYLKEDMPSEDLIRNYIPNIEKFGLLFSYTQP